MAISKRLKALADMIPPGNRLIDIGCDHALLDIYLIKINKIKEAIAIDINENALEGAKNNIKAASLENQIRLVHNDGLNSVNIQQEDIIIIAGMGFKNIKKILLNHLNKINYIIIQSNNEYMELRKWLHKAGFVINNEQLVVEKGKQYLLIGWNRGSKKYHYLDYWLGPFLKNNNQYLLFLHNYYQDLLKEVPSRFIIKRYQIKRRISFLKKKSRSSHIIGSI